MSKIKVDKYEHEKLKGFLIINFSKKSYLEMGFSDPLEKVDDFYIFDKDQYQELLNNIIKTANRVEGGYELIDKIENDYKPNIIHFQNPQIRKQNKGGFKR